MSLAIPNPPQETNYPDGIEILGAETPNQTSILTPDALAFVAALHRKHNPTREKLLADRQTRKAKLTAGEIPGYLPETKDIREGDWKVAPVPDDIQKRWVEITGPVERKMMINALNSGANVFMADFEDSLSPTWENAVEGQMNCYDAVRRVITFTDPVKNKHYELKDGEIATLMVRPRGWHLVEPRVLVDGKPISASIFDFGLYFFHNAKELLERGTGPYYYLAKLESHHEARLWNDIFVDAQDMLGTGQGKIRVTVLIETILAALEMDEILYELRDHIAGLNAGRWDYIFSAIKKFATHSDMVLPDRGQVTMTVPFMRAYTELMVHTCHKRGAHAIGGMAAFIPSRRDEEVNQTAFTKVRADKERESADGCDGTWVAHPDLVPLVYGIFQEQLGDKLHQKDRLREDVAYTDKDIVNVGVPGGTITEEGLRVNIRVSLQYLEAWLHGSGAVALYNLMEDTATAEISRAQIWQWIHHKATLADGRPITRELYKTIRAEEYDALVANRPGKFKEAADIFDQLILTDEFVDFLTLIAIPYLD